VDTVTLNVLAAADDVLIPIRPDEFSFSGLLDLVEQVNGVREAVNAGLTLRGAFFTHWQNRETFWQARRSLEDSGICPVFQTAIGYNPKVPESTLEEMPLCAFAPRSWAAIQYKKLTAEYLALTDSGKGKEG
jgi:chromosome partitioning protein